jgi:hypothetical protein
MHSSPMCSCKGAAWSIRAPLTLCCVRAGPARRRAALSWRQRPVDTKAQGTRHVELRTAVMICGLYAHRRLFREACLCRLKRDMIERAPQAGQRLKGSHAENLVPWNSRLSGIRLCCMGSLLAGGDRRGRGCRGRSGVARRTPGGMAGELTAPFLRRRPLLLVDTTTQQLHNWPYVYTECTVCGVSEPGRVTRRRSPSTLANRFPTAQPFHTPSRPSAAPVSSPGTTQRCWRGRRVRDASWCVRGRGMSHAGAPTLGMSQMRLGVRLPGSTAVKTVICDCTDGAATKACGVSTLRGRHSTLILR